MSVVNKWTLFCYFVFNHHQPVGVRTLITWLLRRVRLCDGMLYPHALLVTQLGSLPVNVKLLGL